MVPDQSKTCLGLEYFCFEGDGLWTMSDADLIELGKRELIQIGMITESDFEDGTVIRMPKAYPVYDSTYSESLRIVQEFLANFANLQLVAAMACTQYNNQDHSMLTRHVGGQKYSGWKHDLWQVNAEQDYHEEVTAGETQTADSRAGSPPPNRAFPRVR